MVYSDSELDTLSQSDEYAEYIMAHCGGDRIVCNGDTLVLAMEELYLFDEFVKSKLESLT